MVRYCPPKLCEYDYGVLYLVFVNTVYRSLCVLWAADLLSNQVDRIKELSDKIAKLKRVGPGLGEIILDKEVLKEVLKESRDRNDLKERIDRRLKKRIDRDNVKDAE